MAEEHKKVQEDIKEPETKEIEKPKPKPEAFFDDIDNRDRFEKLSDGTKNFAEGLYERTKINIVDRTKVMFNDKLFEWHHEKSALLKFKLDEKEKDIQRLEELKAGHSERLVSIQKELGPISPKLLAKAELEKEGIQKNIDKEKAGLDSFKWRLDYRNEKKGAYETKRNRICENVIEKTNERLKPYEKKLETLKGDKEQLDSEIKLFRDKNKEFSAKTEDLENRMKAAPFKVERKIYRSYIKELKKNIKENDKLINKTINKEAKIDHRVAKFEKKAGPWRDKRNEFERITKLGKAELAEPVKKEAENKETEELKIKKAEPEKKEVGAEWKEAEEVEEKAEKPRWGSISGKERKFWIDRFGKGGAKSLFRQYEGDFEDLAKLRTNQKKYVPEWENLREEQEKEE